jgi:protocatechuate 3,4-dioxygenase beta subunit
LPRLMILWCFVSLSLLAQQQKPALPAPASDFRITGTVVDSAGGQPLAHVRVSIIPLSTREVTGTAVTADDGRFMFGGLVTGKYALAAQCHGYVGERLNQHETFSTSVAVGPDIDSANVIFPLRTESILTGTVTDEFGDAVRAAPVRLFQEAVIAGSRRTRQRAASVTDDEGKYSFSHLPAGRYFVAVAAEPWYAQRPQNNAGMVTVAEESSLRTSGSYSMPAQESIPVEQSPSHLDLAYPVTFFGGATEAAGATAIVLGNGERVSADVNLHPVPALRVRLSVNTSDQGPGFYPLLAQRAFDAVALPVRTQSIQIAPGVIDLVGIVPGHYSMKINKGGGFQTLEEQDVDFSGSGEMEVPPGGAFVPLTATVRMEAPAAMPREATIYLNDKNSARFFVERISDKGEAEFKQVVPPGSYEVSLQSAERIFIKSLSATGAALTGRTLQIKGGGPVKLSVVAAQGEGLISGVALREGKGVPGAMVVLVPADPANNHVLFRRDQSDSDGTFTLANVVPGRYTLVAIENGWAQEWMNPEVLKKFTAQGEPVIVEVKGKYSVKLKVQ